MMHDTWKYNLYFVLTDCSGDGYELCGEDEGERPGRHSSHPGVVGVASDKPGPGHLITIIIIIIIKQQAS